MAAARIKISTSTPFLSSFLEKRLTIEGFQVDFFKDGEALLSAVKNQKTDVVMAQVGISGINGLDICREIKNDAKLSHISVILFSANPANEEPAYSSGAACFMTIPFSETVLMDAVTKAAGTKKSILLVDDSKLIHQRTGEFLRKQGFVVIDAYDGDEGVETATRQKPDLIISDVEMPRLDGFSMCKIIKSRQDTALIPVIIVSSLGQGIDIDRGFDSGANDYLVKPVVNEELLSCINSILRTMEVRRRETVLVVDDSVTITNMLQFGLMQQGFNVIVCNDGETAFEKATTLLPDAIVADLDMPGIDGYQLVRYLKERPETRNIPVVIISSRESRGEVAKGLRIGAAAFVSKPFTIDKVVINVERLTAEKRMNHELEAMKLYLSEAAAEAVARVSLDKGNSSEFSATEKTLTILFSDIVGFTPLSEKYPPAKVVSMLNNYLDVMTTVLKKHEAIIDKFIGDAIMAIFGPSDSGLAPELRAVRAALEMLECQKEFNLSSPHKFQTRIGINKGKVIFGDIGSKFYRRDFTVIGDPVNTAQRLESAAAPDSVLIGESIHQSIGDKIRVTETGDISLKGKKEKIRTYTVLETID